MPVASGEVQQPRSSASLNLKRRRRFLFLAMHGIPSSLLSMCTSSTSKSCLADLFLYIGSLDSGIDTLALTFCPNTSLGKNATR